MRELLEQKFFPFVIKPGRYAGGEPGQIIKNPENRLSYLHAYPDRYEIGHAYVGLQTLYHIVNADDRFLCERAFAVDHDAEALMRREQIPLFSLESSRPIAEFDAIGFTLVNELVFTNLLTMLELGGIPLRSVDRTEKHPIIMAGGPAAYFSEPISAFMDLIFVGDAEEGLPEVLAVLHRMRSASRQEKLLTLAREVASVYVPSLYDADHQPLIEGIPARIRARLVDKLKKEYYPAQPIVPMIETVHNYLNIEIMRGCPQGCRFCMAGAIYKPVRLRSRADIAEQVETQLDASGYGDISLMSLSSSDYPEIEQLAATLATRLEPKRVGLFLPSLRPGSVTPGLLDAVKRVRRGGFTIAPEAGTERLRKFVRKDITDTQILDTARMAFDKGWTTIKLYFIIGLPTETDDDLIAIADLCRRIFELGQSTPGRKQINVTLSPFVPSPHTPLQWDAACPQEELSRRVTLIRRHTHNHQINYKYSESLMHYFVCAFLRGGRELCDVVETAYRLGCRFDGWDEERQPERWLRAFEQNGLDPLKYLQAIPFSATLPWGHIDKGQSTEHLIAERQRTSAETFSRPSTTAPPIDTAPVASASDDSAQWGRGKKKVAAKSTAAPTKNRLRLRWGKSARYRYMSHLDNLRLLERVLRRAGTPVQYSQGFNPTMRLSFGPPLPLGFTSEAEYLDITLETNLLPYMLDDIKKRLPDGLEILEARVVYGQAGSLTSLINRVVYTIPISFWSDVSALQSQIDRIMAGDTAIIERDTKEGIKTMDIKPAVFDLCIDAGNLLLTLGVGEVGYARPNEVAQLLRDSLICRIVALPFHRKAMYRVANDGRIINPLDL